MRGEPGLTDPERLDALNLSDFSFWALPHEEHQAAFAALRAERPVWWFPEPDRPDYPAGPGYWAVTRYDDVRHVSRHPELFISGRSATIADPPAGTEELFGSILNMDAPRHSQLRAIVNRAFTPRAVERLDRDIRRRAQVIVAGVAERGSCDFAADVAALLPLEVICGLIGIAPEHHARVLELTTVLSSLGSVTTQQVVDAVLELNGLALAIAEDRLSHPVDDIATTLLHAEVDGARLTAQEFASFFILLAGAGAETTRTALSHGLLLLTRHPDQRQLWSSRFEELAAAAVDEILRWSTPVRHMRRTASQDTEIAGQPVAAGEKVVMWYSSANWDGEHFADPGRFDITRSPNDHFGFGAGGPHYCLGAHLARSEITAVFEELFRLCPDIEAVEPAEMVASWWVHGVRSLPCQWTPR